MEAKKLFPFDEVCRLRESWRAEGHRVALTNGCFDLLHPGHLFLLEQAAQFGQRLIVALNSDGSVRTLKGAGRPILHEYLRAYSLSAVRWVDAVFLFDGTRAVEEIRRLKPDVYVRAADRTVTDLDSRELRALGEVNATIEFVEFFPNLSTTAIVREVRGRPSPGGSSLPPVALRWPPPGEKVLGCAAAGQKND